MKRAGPCWWSGRPRSQPPRRGIPAMRARDTPAMSQRSRGWPETRADAPSEKRNTGRLGRPRRKEQDMRKAFEIGGVVAAAVLIAFGIASIVMSTNGQSTVKNSLKQEQITGTPDMSPSGIAAEVKADKAAQTKLFAQLHAAGVKITPSPI